MNDINNKLKQLNTEDFIWIIYIGIIILSLYSNILERKYYIYNDLASKEKYSNINIFIFSILLIVYIYFFKNSYNDLKNLKQTDSIKKKKLVTASFIASLLITISGTLFLYIALNNENLDVEIAFN